MKRIKYISQRTLAHIREIGLIYFVQLIFGLVVALIICSIINKHLGQSIALEQLALGFDRTVIMDMVYNNEGAFSPVTSSLIFLLPLYLLVSIVLQGGLLSNIKLGATSIKNQIKSGLKYFFPFLWIVIISFLLLLIVGLTIGFPFSKIVGDPLMTFSSEKPFVLWLIALASFFSLVIVFVWSWSVGSRFAYIEGHSFINSLKEGIKFLKRNYSQLFAIGYLLFGINIVLGIIYYLIMGDRGAPSYTIVIFAFFVQQIFSFLRVLLRGFGYVALEQIEDEY